MFDLFLYSQFNLRLIVPGKNILKGNSILPLLDMSIPNLTKTLFLSLAELTANPKVADQLAVLINTAFTRSHMNDPNRWNIPCNRFPKTQHMLDTVGKDGVMAVILDESCVGKDHEAILVEASGNEAAKRGKLIACAAIIPWRGGWEKEGSSSEVGWETKAVAVDENERYLKKGIVIKLLKDIDHYLIEKERVLIAARKVDQMEDVSKSEEHSVLTLWLLTAECLNGAYWRRRGYTEVRRKTWSEIWGCLKSFDMVVMRRDVRYDLLN
jgi:hypothetical protein